MKKSFWFLLFVGLMLLFPVVNAMDSSPLISHFPNYLIHPHGIFEVIFHSLDQNIKESEILFNPALSEIKLKEELKKPTSLKEDFEDSFTFDWRDRHGYNWITPLKSQQCGDCAVHATTGAMEAIARLYYNQPDLDIIFSEQDLLSCYPPVNDCNGGTPLEAIEHVIDEGIAETSCYPYLGPDGPECEPPYSECPKWRISSSEEYQANDISELRLKNLLITKGPLAFYSNGRWSEHAMVAVGFGEIVGGTGECFYNESFTCFTIPEDSPLVGKTYWIMKDSWFGRVGFTNFVITNPEVNTFYTLEGPILPPEGINYETQCTDKDGDGFYFWGASEFFPDNCECPSDSCPKDCDDSDPSLGVCPEGYACGSYSYVPSGEQISFGGYTSFGELSCCGDQDGEILIDEQVCCEYQEGYGIFSEINSEGFPECQKYLLGDANCDNRLTLADVSYTINYFRGRRYNPDCPILSMDSNGDCRVLGGDVTYLVRYLRGIGSPPKACRN